MFLYIHTYIYIYIYIRHIYMYKYFRPQIASPGFRPRRFEERSALRCRRALAFKGGAPQSTGRAFRSDGGQVSVFHWRLCPLEKLKRNEFPVAKPTQLEKPRETYTMVVFRKWMCSAWRAPFWMVWKGFQNEAILCSSYKI